MEELLKLAPRHPSIASLAREIGVRAGTLQARLRAEDPENRIVEALYQPERGGDPPGFHEGPEGTASVTSDPSNSPPAPWKPEELLKAHGLDPEDWEITRVRGNRWGNPGEPMHQLRVDVIPKRLLLQIPDLEGWSAPKPRPRFTPDPKRHITISDHHAPHHDKVFHRLFLDYLADEQPDEIDVNGDLFDFATISKHREREGFAQGVNECLESGFHILMDYRSVCPDAIIKLKRGNHCERLLHAIMDNVRELHRVRPAGEETPALDLRRLLHLDRLHIDYVDEEWDRARTRPSAKLTIRHGYATGKNATNSMLSKLAGSTVQGHTHRLSLLFRTEHTEDEDEPTVTRMGAEAGCACEIDEGLGYVAGGEPDWQQGALLSYVWPNGDFLSQPIVYVPGRLLAPGGKRYVA